MTDYPLDIIIPVWNGPVEVRSALASFVSDSPMARLVMVNNGSERETEAILDEFAEALDDQALLVASGRNIGTVAALNLGLSRASAPLLMLVTPFTRVGTGWFESVGAFFEQNEDVGAVVLRNNKAAARACATEADHGSFEAMILRRSLHESIGDFDASLDGAEWSLRDYARRSLAAGYRTVSLYCRQLSLLQHTEFGSVARREERCRLARESYIGRWGAPKSYFLHIDENLFGLTIDSLKDSLLESARQGDRLVVSVESKVSKSLLNKGLQSLHENVAVHPLPRLFAKRALIKEAERLYAVDPTAILIAESDIVDGTLQRTSFADFLSAVNKRKTSYYFKEK